MSRLTRKRGWLEVVPGGESLPLEPPFYIVRRITMQPRGDWFSQYPMDVFSSYIAKEEDENGVPGYYVSVELLNVPIAYRRVGIDSDPFAVADELLVNLTNQILEAVQESGFVDMKSAAPKGDCDEQDEDE